MPHPFDPGYGGAPFKALCENYPDDTVYPSDAFRVEWGPIFHRGRLDGSARVFVIGQDPAANENILRRILVGEAGVRTQGFLFKLGIDTSYVMINTFLYSAYSQPKAETHKGDSAILAYRHKWFDALLVGSSVQAVVALGALADGAWQTWKKTPTGKASTLAYQKITHPTAPESSAKTNKTKLAAATKALFTNWNAALQALASVITKPDTVRPLVLYGSAWGPGDKVGIPEIDIPPGIPPWMRGADPWAGRTGTTAAAKRATITVTVPGAFMP